MAKLKLNLPTGMMVEKPVITCFEADSNKYLILDAENIGSMGLPIILVCKIADNRVVKITDATEWQKAKDYLKGIIAGNSMTYLPVSPDMAADEVYYTQLTLPLASFDIIKNAYKVESAPEIPVVPVVESEPVIEPVIPDANAVVPEIEPQVQVEQPVIEIPAAPVEPVIPAAPVSDPVIPTVETAVPASSTVDFAESKEAFMKACENMFDALVAKFQAELDSKK